MRRAALAVIAAALSVSPGRAQAPPAEPRPPPLTTLPSEEDWSYFREPARRRGLLGAVKYIPLRAGWYLSLGGEARPYYERYSDEEWGAEPRDGDGWLLQRYMAHASLHAGPHLRLFGQLKANRSWDRAGGPRPPDEDRLDVNQLFAEVGLAPPTAGGAAPLSLRLGRQELQFGSGRLVSVREGPNTRYGWDGVRATVRGAAWRVDAWGARPVETDPGVFDDSWIQEEGFWGVYATRPLPALPGAAVDLFYLGYERGMARYDQGRAPETRHSLGARLWNRGQAWDYDLEAAGQAGEFGEGRIRAWMLAWTAGHTWHGARWTPRLGLNGGVVSGDGDRADRDMGTFDPPAPRGSYFGQATPLGPGNIMGVAPELEVEPAPGVSVTLDSFLFWRQSTDDGVYGVPGNLVRADSASGARFVAAQPQVEVRWQANRHARLTFNYAHVVAGRFLKETGPSDDIDYVAAFVTLKF